MGRSRTARWRSCNERMAGRGCEGNFFNKAVTGLEKSQPLHAKSYFYGDHAYVGLQSQLFVAPKRRRFARHANETTP